ncbi:L-glutaminase [Fodinibius roseus]|uniref:L-glutaminase n=1 Tax=Fodinibius roseus TaxID=1194090 RepID=A0A1M5FXA7_9BACT|nr:glutaminase family protein [Fodinibius roseus]SHF96093.1 L-glutaminase [Fodinibius roseus]
MKSVKKFIFLLTLSLFLVPFQSSAQPEQQLRPPAYPLITVDPNFSIWSMQDTLYNGPTRHWTGQEHSLQGIIRVDGESYYFMGQSIPRYNVLLPMAQDKGQWTFTTSQPSDGWQNNNFTTQNWKEGRGAFTDGEEVPNPWNTREIWARRTFEIDDVNEVDAEKLLLNVQHDDDLAVYINGVPAFEREGVTNPAALVQVNPEALDALREGENIIAAHCINTGGLAYLDVGLVEELESAVQISNARQTNAEVSATQTEYTFESGPVELKATFTAPLLPDNLEQISRPANYISFDVRSTDGASHDVQIYLSAASNIAVNTTDQEVVWQRMPSRSLDIMRVGTATQQVLGRKGDNVRIDWGHLYMAAPGVEGLSSRMTANGTSVADFVDDGKLSSRDEGAMPRAVRSDPLTLAAAYDLGPVSKDPQSRHITLAYDDLYAIEYFHQPLQAWWKTGSGSAIDMLHRSEAEYDSLMQAATEFDRNLFEEARQAGGRKYAELTELAYRQSVAAHKLVASPEGKPLFFSKENFSNGSIGTVDVTYPSSPLFLYYNPELLKGMLRPIFYYRESGRWDKPFAAHDVGTYPIANGQTYGGDMPVEESGNMLIMTTAIARAEGNAEFAANHWESLTEWADYLMEHGMDPKNQLSTDDFAGHLARNANLSIKAILGIAGYGQLADRLGKAEVAEKYTSAAKDMARKWMNMADAGDHYMLAFGNPDTWSQKYNLVWDHLLDLNVFPDSIDEREIAYYLKQQNEYGLPLDNRALYTKSDWIMWTATLAEDQDTFREFIYPMYRAFDTTEDRVPMTDWYWTDSGDQRGFQARSVVGGYFIKMLEEKMK